MQEWMTLPGFRTFKDFFRQLAGKKFKAIVPDETRERHYIGSILHIEALPEEPTRAIVGDWHEHARIREVREYDDFDYVRASVTSLGIEGDWTEPINLMMLFSKGNEPVLQTYTFIRGIGRMEKGIRSYLWGVGLWGYSLEQVIEHLWTMDKMLSRGGIVATGNTIRLTVENFARGSEYVRILPLGFGSYKFEWFSHDLPYAFKYDNNGDGNSVHEAEHFLRTFSSSGFIGVQDMYEWNHKDVDEILEEHRSIQPNARDRIRAQGYRNQKWSRWVAG